MPFWDLLFRVGGDTKPLRQDLERAGVHMEAAGKKIGKRFGLSWANALAGVVITAAAALGAAFRGAMQDAIENLRESARLGIKVDDFAAIKKLAEETGVAIDVLAEALKRGGQDAEHLRKQMDETRKGLVEQPDWATGWLKAMGNATATGWQSFKNIVGTVAAYGAERASVLGGAIKGGIKGIGALLNGGGLSGFYDELTTGIAEGATAGDTAEARSRVMTAESRILEKKAQRKKDEEGKKSEKQRVRGGFEDLRTKSSADALAQVGIFTGGFGAHQAKWQDKVLSSLEQIARNTKSGTAGGPPGVITL